MNIHKWNTAKQRMTIKIRLHNKICAKSNFRFEDCFYWAFSKKKLFWHLMNCWHANRWSTYTPRERDNKTLDRDEAANQCHHQIKPINRCKKKYEMLNENTHCTQSFTWKWHTLCQNYFEKKKKIIYVRLTRTNDTIHTHIHTSFDFHRKPIRFDFTVFFFA